MLQKSLLSHTFHILRFKFVFCSKRMKTILTIIINVVPLNSADSFLLQYKAILYFFHGLMGKL